MRFSRALPKAAGARPVTLRALRSFAGLAAAAICVAPASAHPEKQILNGYRVASTDIIKHIYFNAATGELIRTRPGGARDDANPVWINEQYDQCGLGEWVYYPIRDSATGEDTHWLDWGDIADNSVIDCFTMLYYTEVPDAEEDGEDGFRINLSFVDGADWCCELYCTALPYLTWEIDGVPGSASGGAAWLITIDFSTAGTPEHYFEVGDSDGVDDSGNGLYSGGLGRDVDGLNNGADFGYGCAFDHPATLIAGASGCGLVVPPGATEPNALGSEDVMALFIGGWDTLDGFYWFGGSDCSGGADYNWNPWADYYLGLYSPNAPPSGCHECGDCTADGVLDFFDVQLFLNYFAAHDPEADMNSDGVWDFFDVQVYLGFFSIGCP